MALLGECSGCGKLGNGVEWRAHCWIGICASCLLLPSIGPKARFFYHYWAIQVTRHSMGRCRGVAFQDAFFRRAIVGKIHGPYFSRVCRRADSSELILNLRLTALEPNRYSAHRGPRSADEEILRFRDDWYLTYLQDCFGQVNPNVGTPTRNCTATPLWQYRDDGLQHLQHPFCAETLPMFNYNLYQLTNGSTVQYAI